MEVLRRVGLFLLLGIELGHFAGDEGGGVVCVWVWLNDFGLLCDCVCCCDDVFIKHFGLTGYAATNTNLKTRTTALI